jgi:Mobilization protein NikA
MPRKRTHAEAPRTEMVTVRLTPAMYVKLESNARRLGLTRAGYLHHLVDNRSVEATATTSADLLPIVLINQLKRIGNNLNQLAHAANAGLPVSQTKLASHLRDLIDTLLEHELTARRVRAAI